jgi:hypothetical protein
MIFYFLYSTAAINPDFSSNALKNLGAGGIQALLRPGYTLRIYFCQRPKECFISSKGVIKFIFWRKIAVGRLEISPLEG